MKYFFYKYILSRKTCFEREAIFQADASNGFFSFCLRSLTSVVQILITNYTKPTVFIGSHLVCQFLPSVDWFNWLLASVFTSQIRLRQPHPVQSFVSKETRLDFLCLSHTHEFGWMRETIEWRTFHYSLQLYTRANKDCQYAAIVIKTVGGIVCSFWGVSDENGIGRMLYHAV